MHHFPHFPEKMIWRLISILLIAILLTVITQVGGVIFILSLATFGIINKKISRSSLRFTGKIFSFLLLYLIFVFAIEPGLAQRYGRVPLPLLETRSLKPAHLVTCFLNRNYVRQELRSAAFAVAEEMNQVFPGNTVNYLDANFPFINTFPLYPHLSHNDGKKLDLSFQYRESKTNLTTNSVPSMIGYGICEEPLSGEENMPAACARQGYWQYSILKQIIPQGNKSKFTVDEKRTAALVNHFASQEGITRIFIEPHLKSRLRLTTNKIVFHGCKAVRHDDHVHVQIK